MRVHGWCTTCRRFKVVRVNFGRGQIGVVYQGECDGCVDAREAKRKEQRDGPHQV